MASPIYAEDTAQRKNSARRLAQAQAFILWLHAMFQIKGKCSKKHLYHRFAESHKEATKGDVKQQALLGQMLIDGYGCKKNVEIGKIWAEKARRRGYRMAGVYCEI